MSSSPPKDDPARARAYAFVLLKFRPRTEHELRQRLARKRFGSRVIEQTVSWLRERRFIDDETFARSWVESRVRLPYGLRRIRSELTLKGISPRHIAGALERIKADYREDEVIRELAQRKLRSLRDLEPRIARQRLYAYLVRRGFSPESVTDTVSLLLHDDSRSDT